MLKFLKSVKDRLIVNIVTVCVGILFYMFLSHFSIITDFVHEMFRVIQPVIIGLVVAYLVDPIVKFCENKLFTKIKLQDTRRSISVICSVIFVLFWVVTLFILLVPSLINSIEGIISNIDTYKSNLNVMFDIINSWNIGIDADMPALIAYIEDLINDGITFIAQNIDKVLEFSQSLGVVILNFLVGFILGVYFLLDKVSLLQGLNDLRYAIFKSKNVKQQDIFLVRCHDILIRYIGYDLLDGLVVGIINAVVMLILQMPEVTLVSVIVGVTNLLPTFGPVVGLVIGSIILFLSKPIYVIWFLILTMILQTVDGYLLKPKLFGGVLGVPPVWTLMSVVICGKLLGVVGILLAIPFVAVLTFVYKESFLPWVRTKNNI